MNLINHKVWYKNCKRQRKVEAKICQDCPFRKIIERSENGEMILPHTIKMY